MLAAFGQTSAHLFTMAEDDMEISSEHGHNDGDEDIDIDIDFAAPQTDEDHVLEDIISYENVEESFPQQLPASDFPDDEEMVDEDNQSYHMDDADLLHDEGALAASTDDTDLLHSQEVPAVAQDDAEILHEEASVAIPGDAEILRDDEAPAATIVGTNAVHSEEVPHTSREMASSGTDALSSTNNIAEISTLKPDDIENQDTIDFDHFNEGQETPAAYTDHQGNSHDPENSDATAPVEVTEDESQHVLPIPALDGHGTIDVEAFEETQNSISIHKSGGNSPAGTTLVDTERAEQYNPVSSSALPHIIVSWDGKDYPLFSTSESDDPDSYFLSDTSILNKPLVKFLEAIRDVVHSDLSDEDELVLSIDDLGLEISESANKDTDMKGAHLDLSTQTNTSVQSMSLEGIMNLRQQLLRNDGVSDASDESLDLLFVSITAKKSFFKRLSKLIAGAAEGKGLSDFWEEHSQSQMEGGDGLDDQYEHEPAPESHSPSNAVDGRANEDLEGKTEDHVEREDIKNSFQDGPNVVSQDQEPSLSPSGDVQDPEVGKAASESGDDINEASAQSAPEVDVPKTDLVLESGIDEESDDVIDYSDEELESGDGQKDISRPETDSDRQDNGIFANFIPPLCLLPLRCFCPECSELLAEHDQIDEDLNRRSRSRLSGENQVVELKPRALGFTEGVGDDLWKVAEGVVNDVQYMKGALNCEAEADLGYQDHGYDTTTNDAPLEHEDYGASYDDDGSSGGGALLNDYVGFEHSNEGEESTELAGDFESFEAAASFGDEANLEVFSLAEEEISTNIGNSPGRSKEYEVSDHTTNSATGSLANLESAESSVTLDIDDNIFDEDAEEAADDLSHPETELLIGGATVNGLEVKDEIDYEDDEEEVDERPVMIRDGYSPPQIEEKSPANGKRTIAEVDSDDALDTRANSECYPRFLRRRLC